MSEVEDFNITKNTSGIYCIRNIKNGKIYIGKSKDIKTRIRSHIWDLKRNIHHSPSLQNSFNKNGINNYEYFIIEKVIEDIDLIEEKYIALYQSNNSKIGYNTRNSIESKLQLKIDAIERYKLPDNNFRKAQLASAEARRLKCYQFDLTGNLIKIWNSISEASKILKLDSSTITKVCKKKVGYCNNYVFSYENIFYLKQDNLRTKISVLNTKTNETIIYNSISIMCKCIGIKNTRNIHRAIKSQNKKYKNFIITKI